MNADSDEDKAVFSYEFQFGADYLSYEYKKNERNELCEEKLEVNNISGFRDVDFELDERMLMRLGRVLAVHSRLLPRVHL